MLPILRSKSNSYFSSTVALLFPTIPLIIEFFPKSPTTPVSFNVLDSGSQPSFVTNPYVMPVPTVTFSDSENVISLNIGVKDARSVDLITLPNAAFWALLYVPPVLPIPAIEYVTLSVPPIVLIPVTVKNLYP